MTLAGINQMGRRNRYRGEAIVPPVIEDILRRLNDRISEGLEGRVRKIPVVDDARMSDGLDEADPDRIVDDVWTETDQIHRQGNGSPSVDGFNMIPSSSNRRGCTELLVTFCFQNDSFEKRLLESLDHVSKHCRNTKDIYFITTKWNSAIFEKYDGYLEMVRDTPLNIVFIYVGKEGFVWMPE